MCRLAGGSSLHSSSAVKRHTFEQSGELHIVSYLKVARLLIALVIIYSFIICHL